MILPAAGLDGLQAMRIKKTRKCEQFPQQVKVWNFKALF
jgi:hypothetical protein